MVADGGRLCDNNANPTTGTDMKKTLFALCSLSLVIAGGCSGEKKTVDAPQNRPSIGVAIPAADHGWTAGVGWWAEKWQKEHPEVDWQYQRAADIKTQADQVEAMLTKGVDALVLQPLDSDGLIPIVKRAREQGVYVVTVDRGLRDSSADLYIAGNNATFGSKAAEFIAEKLGGKGKIVILRGISCIVDTERFDGAKAVFNKFPDIEILGDQPGEWNREKAHTVMQDFLTKFDHIDAVWAADDDMAIGAEQAIREAGRQDEMWIVGGACMKEIVKRIMEKDPVYPANVTYPPEMIAAGMGFAIAQTTGVKDGAEIAKLLPPQLGIGGDQATKALDESEKQVDFILETRLVTPENAKDFYFPESPF